MKIKRIITFCAVVAMLTGAGFAAASCNHQPVVMIHGYLGSTSNFNTMQSRLNNDGVPSCALYRFGYNSVGSSNKTSASRLKSYVNSALSSTGQSKAKLIAHSNGGLVSRWYRVFEGGSKKTSRLITLGTPHKGTTWAYGCFSPACFEMRPNSSFLRSLGGKGCNISLWSSADGIIIPSSSAKCGKSIRTASVGHNTLLTSSSVYRDVINNL
ncbi:MAG: hypothetical protein C9356_15560 [Oleiphilus sp.]|nr:MAG: hypothetical protein C9356_15560 [Oleiphilus sp.]